MDENFDERSDEVAEEPEPIAPVRAPSPAGDEEAPRESRGPAGGRRRYIGRQKVCAFCVDRTSKIDYKNYDMLRRFLTERAKIRPRRQTGTCARHQRAVSRAIKRARHLALLPFVASQHQDL